MDFFPIIHKNILHFSVSLTAVFVLQITYFSVYSLLMVRLALLFTGTVLLLTGLKYCFRDSA